jgi:hypothetical protein
MPAGAPITLTQEKINDICDLVRAGNYVETALAQLNIKKPAFYDWLRRGRAERDRVAKNPRYKIRQSESIFVELSYAFERAEAQAEIIRVQVITKAAKDDPKWAAWYLARKNPDHWSEAHTREMAKLAREKFEWEKAEFEKFKKEFEEFKAMRGKE